jgi:hypothetical protein
LRVCRCRWRGCGKPIPRPDDHRFRHILPDGDWGEWFVYFKIVAERVRNWYDDFLPDLLLRRGWKKEGWQGCSRRRGCNDLLRGWLRWAQRWGLDPPLTGREGLSNRRRD